MTGGACGRVGRIMLAGLCCISSHFATRAGNMSPRTFFREVTQ